MNVFGFKEGDVLWFIDTAAHSLLHRYRWMPSDVLPEVLNLDVHFPYNNFLHSV